MGIANSNDKNTYIYCMAASVTSWEAIKKQVSTFHVEEVGGGGGNFLT